MEEALGVWRTLLLPLTSDPNLEVQIQCFQKALKGTKITPEILKVCSVVYALDMDTSNCICLFKPAVEH